MINDNHFMITAIVILKNNISITTITISVTTISIIILILHFYL